MQEDLMRKLLEIKKRLVKSKKHVFKVSNDLKWRLVRNQKQKVFCIGRNKTGTTSVEFVLREFGYKMGHQPTAERLLPHYAKGDWKPILEYCKTAQAFQDAPFSWPETWKILVKAYPNAKFILTYRDEESWYNSITRFHSKLFADGKRIPTKEDLKNASYRYRGFMWDTNRAVYNTPDNDPYNKEILISNYSKHNNDVLAHFNRHTNFLAVDVSHPGSYHKLCEFLGHTPLHKEFPHLNKTAVK